MELFVKDIDKLKIFWDNQYYHFLFIGGYS